MQAVTHQQAAQHPQQVWGGAPGLHQQPAGSAQPTYAQHVQAWGQSGPSHPTPQQQHTGAWGQGAGTWGSPAPYGAAQQGRAARALPQAGGEQVGPAVVVFGNDDKAGLKAYLKQIHPTAAAAVLSVHRLVGIAGGVRFELHCKASQVGLVCSLVPLLKASNTHAKVWEPRSGQKSPSGLAQVATAGLSSAAATAGVCKYFATNTPCPHGARHAGCRFHCYAGPPRRQ